MNVNLNITVDLDLRPHKASKKPDLPTISESEPINFKRTRAQMRKQLMRQSFLVGNARMFNVKNPPEPLTRFQKLQSGLNMLIFINRHGFNL